MKEIRACAIATALTVAILIACAFTLSASAEVGNRGEFYPRLTVVVETEQIANNFWTVTCEDKDGNLWMFYDDEGTWEPGDIANFLMWNMGECEEDDEIIEVYWEGYTEDITFWMHENGWR